MVQALAGLFPLDRQRIVFYAYKRKGFCCNPKYIALSLLKDFSGEYRLYWASAWPETVDCPSGCTVIRLGSLRFYYLCARAKLLVTNDKLDGFLCKRRGQLYMNTWHGGGAFKKAGLDAARNEGEAAAVRLWYGDMDYMLVSSLYLREAFSRAFSLPPERVLATGMPRSDVLLSPPSGIREAVRERYGFDAAVQVVLFAPTYSTDMNPVPLSGADCAAVLAALSRRFGGEWRMLSRSHYFDGDAPCTGFPGGTACCNDWYDAQELLCAVDVLITDYSSLLWDFTLLGRPAFRLAADPEGYGAEERGFYMPYGEWPYPHARTAAELAAQVAVYDAEYWRGRQEAFLRFVGNCDRGCSSRLAGEAVRKIMSDGERE